MPKLKPLTIVALSVGAIAMGGGLTVKREVDSEIHYIIRCRDQMRSDRAKEVDLRDALWGESVDERAWPHYRASTSALLGITDVRERARVASLPDYDADERRALVVEGAAVLEALERGAHACDATHIADWTKGFEAEIMSLRDVRTVWNLAIARALVLTEDGESVRAVRALLDAHQFARDLATAPILIEEMIGCALLAPDALLDCLGSGQFDGLSDESKALWSEGLLVLNAGLSRGSVGFRGEVYLLAEHFGSQLEGRSDLQGVFDNVELGWRYRFSASVAVADYLRRASDLVPRLEACYELPGQDAEASASELFAGFADDPNPIVRICLPKLDSALHSRFYCRTKLNFLVHAIDVDLERAPGLPEDPFGNGIDVVDDVTGVRVSTEVERGRTIEVAIKRSR